MTVKVKLVEQTVRATQRGAGNRAGDVERFTRLFFANVSSLWKFAQNRKPGTAKIRVFNPDRKKDGWSCGHTVVEIVNDDMPFLVDSITAEMNTGT